VFPKPMGGKEAHEIHDRPALQKGEQEGESERRTDEALRYYRNPSEEVPPDDLPAYLSVCVCMCECVWCLMCVYVVVVAVSVAVCVCG
jgi:hypothetical protein